MQTVEEEGVEEAVKAVGAGQGNGGRSRFYHAPHSFEQG
ncbi:hypothetical protein QG37_00956 [Candidozyma auris]|uniref:Uncharacterized protein n=1 Tax=Candidozyma auris TaxID=498019 RepID=A0A0L0P6N8_CANAR|nr:hypothetical protein QG37_00956 [[Candida] auris]